jgi:hypothetical protein
MAEPPISEKSAAAAPSTERAGGERAEYEFNAGANLVIGGCGNRARIFGILCSITGALQLIAALLGVTGLVSGSVALFLAPSGVFNLVFGVLLAHAGTTLTDVVNTQGRDVTLMLRALGAFSKAFLVQIVAAIVLVVWVGVTLAGVALTSGGILSKITE